MTIINRHHSHDHLLFALLALWLLIAFLWVAHSPALAQTINDGEITLAIDRLLMSDQGVSAHALDVQTSDGIVTVSGVVSHLLARERAAQIAATVKGVRAVVNLIEVSPKMFPDAVLRSEIAQALADDPATDLLNIEVTVNNATAMLSGKADSWSQEQLCLAVAKGVRGVKAVTSKMEVSQQTKRPDQEIEAEIERRLFFDVWIDESLITVKVKFGRVELGGAVASLAEKQRAFTKAWVAGVAAVEDKNLVVDWSLLDEMRRGPVTPPAQSDMQTEQALKDAFKNDPRLSSLDLDVSFETGVATLRGLVSSLQARKAAEADARNTRGVWQVRNHLKVRPEMAPTTRPKPDFNAKLAEKVRLSLLRNPYTHQHKIGVTVNDQMVILDGTVSSTVEKAVSYTHLTLPTTPY